MTELDALWARCLALWDDDTDEAWATFAEYAAATRAAAPSNRDERARL